ncbi:pseudouridylate synthase 7 homolog isoform X2 [Daphnia pulicaria]|uniref:pseudouridylate synthase 7 homolog isoform X2 n=1 Tax=Daphnia pulicaria TaxID=35523 RepID=UPI001EEC5FF9|nr:pseudouridylate synthase 7 homolog isoform X2 [Daphnia pulicaria]
MEEPECEIVFVSNESPKKENILEALTKYKLKQQEQQQHTMETKAGPSKGNVILNDSPALSVKGEVSNETSKGRKGKKLSLEKLSLEKQSSVKPLVTRKSQFTAINVKHYKNKRNRLLMKYMQNAAKSENKLHLENDFEIGITEYISQGRGFSADINHSCSDFQVHEISLDGSVVHLTKMNNPLIKPFPCKGEFVITPEQLNSIDDIMLKTDDDEEIKTTEIDITDISENQRDNLQKILKEKFHVHEPVYVGKQLILKICNMQDEIRRQDGSLDYVQFTMYTEEISTKTAIKKIATRIRKSSDCFMTAEHNIGRSKSNCQLVTMKREDCIGLCVTESLKNISIGNFSFAPKPLQRGDLKGNHFSIALRKIIGDKGHIEANLRSLKDNGFVNYYENLHFGLIRDAPKHLIGKQLLLKKWQEAVDLFLQPHPELKIRDDRFKNITLACIEYKFSRVVDLTFDEDTLKNSIKAQLLSNIQIHGENLDKAVNAIPFCLRLSFVRAYQCFLWNTIVSKRIAKFGAKLIVGDLVYAPVDSGGRDNKRQHNQREVIFIDKNNIHKYTIYDVVLPLPGSNITYPANEVADWYKDHLLADGLLEKDFNSGLKTYGIKNGSYRPVVLRPSNLEWKFVHYDNPGQKLIPSDLDRLHQIELPSVSSQEGVYLGLVLEFSLPAFAWGTMALREILKMDMTAELRKSSKGFRCKKTKLKKQVRLNKVCPKQKRPSPLETKEAVEDQIKETKEKSGMTNPLLSESSKSFLDINQNRLESAASPLSKGKTLRDIKPESGTVEKQPSIDNESFEEPLQTNRIAEKPVASKQLVEQRKNQHQESTSESREFELKGTPATIENQTPETREPFEKPLLKEEPGTSKQSAPIATDFVLELQKNLVVLQPHTCQKSQSIVNECLKEPQTNVKVESGICQMHSSAFTKSCEEPEKKKIKLDTDQEEEVLITQSCKGSKFKSIIYIDIISDQED